MLVVLLAYLGGILTILSPCILPVLPFVFARADKPFLTNGLPLLGGMAITFSGIATLAAYGGDSAILANQWGRYLAMALLAGFALLLIVPRWSGRVMAPLVRLGERLSARAEGREGIGSSLLLGAATGLLWAPCAGPILGLIITGAALSGATSETALLLFAYAAGAATSLALALLVGGKLFAAMKRNLGAGERIRKALGVLILLGVGTIALGLDTRVLARLSTAQTINLEEGLASALGLGSDMPRTSSSRLEDEGPMPPLTGATQWMNSPPLTREQLAGKVVLVDFWTYSCINCIRTVPNVRAWHERYKDDGLVVIGVHTPEFAFERRPANVRKAIADFKITYPVALDNRYAIWRAFNNRYWPAHYLVDAKGRIRYHHFGEGGEEETEAAIRRLLAEAGQRPEGDLSRVERTATEAVSSGLPRTRETYLGHGRAEGFSSPGGFARDSAKSYALPDRFDHGDWGYRGRWTVGRQKATAGEAGTALAIRFRARDLHLVLGSASGKPIRFRITVDGKSPGPIAGVDVDHAGNGVIREQRLYQLVRQNPDAPKKMFTITFLDPGAEAYAFTFG